eukprot:NODE_1702_length_555_cov_459.375494_g1371_i0.p1 GENE.NODE_1702_length_555_cov_459.375494_g1371_i0~~NODE_1702_length_555_cov_459.375494_g1371_i0.p1  ORF type:complete len:168 (-),score=26.06 NODE_1702_length_555_cov_459.375494_g1371_i0:52-534(-)
MGGKEVAGKPLKKILDQARQWRMGPVVLFAEGVRTNGSGILRFAKDLFGEEFTAHIIGFTFDGGLGGVNPCTYPVTGIKGFMYRVCSKFYTIMEVVCVRQDDVSKYGADWGDRLAAKLAECIKQKPLTGIQITSPVVTNSPIVVKKEFLVKYNEDVKRRA